MTNWLKTFAQEIDITIDNGVLPKGTADDGVLDLSLNIIFGIAAMVAILLIAINAFRIIISRGNPQDMNKARDGIIYAAVGLVVIGAAFTIVKLILQGLT